MMVPIIITSLEIVGLLLLVAVLITAVYTIRQHYKTPESLSISQNNYLIPLLAGLSMLGFLTMNLIWTDIWDPDHTLGLNILAGILGINLPLILITIWEWRVFLRQV